MKLIVRATTVAAASAAAASIGIVGAATASAAPVIGGFGTPEQLNDANGALVSSYTVSNLQPSTDMVNVPVTGTLWEATTSVDAVQGTVTPSIPFFNARAADGQNYRVLFQAPSSQGIKSQPLAPGAQTTGKIYFDVTGPPPTQVAYNDAVSDRMIWST